MILELYLCFMIIILYRSFNYKINNIYIYIANSFKNYYHLPNKSIQCKYKKIHYACHYTNKSGVLYHASIYNGNKKIVNFPNSSYSIIMTTEKLSQVMFMKDIGEGKNKYYKLGIDYRLFHNRWHLSVPRYPNLSYFILKSKINFVDINHFMKRNNHIVYIQRAHYKNRLYIVNEINKYYSIHSYGSDLNNRKWPDNISKYEKIEILKEYKFCLAIENSVITWKIGTKFEADKINDDYITEKLIDCFLAGCIPIYFGPSNVDMFLPDNYSIINMRNFRSIHKLTNYIEKIKNNISLIKNHIKWHYNYSKRWFKQFNKIFDYCDVCNYVIKYGNI